MHVKLLITGRVSLSEEIDLMWTEKIKAPLQYHSQQHLFRSRGGEGRFCPWCSRVVGSCNQ